MEKPFYVTDGMNKLGPFSKEEVLQLLYNAHISIMDFIVDSRDNRMCPLLQHEDFGGEGGTHSLTGSAGIAGLNSKSLSDKYGFSDLRKKSDIMKDNKMSERLKRKQEVAQADSHLKEIITANPQLEAKDPPMPQSTPTLGADEATQNTLLGKTATKSSLAIDEFTTTTTLKTNNGTGFFLKVKDKEFGPLKFLILLSLLKQNKITLNTETRSISDPQWKKLSEFLPKELQQTINITPIISNNLLPKAQWKRKNVRVDYDEVVLCNNSRFSFVGKTLDLSAEGLAVAWVYDVPLNEEFELSLFDLEKNLVTIKGRLARKEPLENSSGIPLFKAVFIFKEKIQIRQFIES